MLRSLVGSEMCIRDRGHLIEILHFQEREQGKTNDLKNSLESDIEYANVCFNLLDEDAEDDDFVDVMILSHVFNDICFNKRRF